MVDLSQAEIEQLHAKCWPEAQHWKGKDMNPIKLQKTFGLSVVQAQVLIASWQAHGSFDELNKHSGATAVLGVPDASPCLKQEAQTVEAKTDSAAPADPAPTDADQPHAPAQMEPGAADPVPAFVSPPVVPPPAASSIMHEAPETSSRPASATGETLETVPLASVKIDSDFQIRAETHDDIIKKYARAMKAGATFPPVTLLRLETGELVLVDGFHRIEAMKQLGWVGVQVRILGGSLEEAIAHVMQVNGSHGWPLKPADQKRGLEILLDSEKYRTMSAAKLAKEAGLTDKTVKKWRKAILGISENTHVTMTRDGHTFRRVATTRRPRPKGSAPVTDTSADKPAINTPLTDIPPGAAAMVRQATDSHPAHHVERIGWGELVARTDALVEPGAEAETQRFAAEHPDEARAVLDRLDDLRSRVVAACTHCARGESLLLESVPAQE